MNSVNNKSTKLSIMITFCKQKEFIKDAIESCLKQKYNFPIEILIGLDGEDAESEKIINEYVKLYNFIKLYKVDNSKLDTINIEKASYNRLNLLKHAVGEYICFLDGDDFYIDNSRLQTMVDFLDCNTAYIAAFHDLQVYKHQTKEFKPVKNYRKESCEIKLAKYLKKHIQFACFVYRNIFLGQVPSDLNTAFVNDSTITLYMLRYGKFYYINKPMLGYRTEINSIYTSLPESKKLAYQLLAAEINHQTLSVADSLLCQKYNKLMKNVAKTFIGKKDTLKDDEYEKIYKFACKHSCYFTYSYLNYSNLTLLKKIKLRFYTFIYRKYKTNIALKKCKNKTIYYFDKRSNFGDELNLYICQRILKLNVLKTSKEKADFYAIGSILTYNLSSKSKFNLFKKPLKIWGTGLIKEIDCDKEYLIRNSKVLALRGKYTKERIKKITNKKLDIPLGDPGLLCSKLIDISNIKKKYLVGIIPHYVDKDIDYKKNIKVDNYKVIDITKNPIFILKEIAECETIFSSAMHGLIAADSLGIPNQWIELSKNVIGEGYKFIDYYSVYDIKPKPFNLLNENLTIEKIELLKQNYKKLQLQENIKKINQDLLIVGKQI